MKRRVRSIVLAAALAAMASVPMAGNASHGVIGAGCEGTVAPGATASCETTFELFEDGFDSNFESHANFHELLSMGSVSVEWRDAEDNTILTTTCTLTGLAIELPTAGSETQWVGPFELQNATCATERSDEPTYVEGTQTLIVTAVADSCGTAEVCKFHGHLEISPDTALL